MATRTLDRSQPYRNQPALAASLLVGMLLLLHVVLWQPAVTPLSKALMLAHLGLFLLWQPLWRADQVLGREDLISFGVFTGLFVFWLDWWLLSAWLIVLTGLVAGSSASAVSGRLVHLATLAILLSELLIRALTQAFEINQLPPAVIQSFAYGLPLVTLLLWLLPRSREVGAHAGEVDLLRALNAALVTTVLALGSLLGMYHSGLSYPEALLRCLLAIALLLFLVSWLLTPRLGVNRLLSLWERSLLNIGTPFERWLEEISALVPEQDSSAGLLREGAASLARLAWVLGASWQGPGLRGEVGELGRHYIDVTTPGFGMRVYTQSRPGPMLRLHCSLLVRLLGHFVRAKAAEEALAAATRLRAVHETGARVTHDMRNLLQGLQPLVAAMSQRPPQGPETDRLLNLLVGALPEFGRRLAHAVDKLQSPATAMPLQWQEAQAWWTSVQERRAHPRIAFQAQGTLAGTRIPASVFDNVLDNLLDNALRKPRATGGGHATANVRVECQATDTGLALVVMDDGPGIDEDLAARLCRLPVDSHEGLGIGLYQAALLAETADYALQLRDHRAGRVSFTLTPM